MTRVLIAPNAFKGTFSPTEATEAIKDGVVQFSKLCNRQVSIECAPLADGGDGTIEALLVGAGGTRYQCTVSGALGQPQLASYLVLDRTAVVELASACGIAGLQNRLDPVKAQTAGLGQVILEVVRLHNVDKIVIAVGGSASTDGGSGALSALGVRFFDSSGNIISVQGGGSLLDVRTCDVSALRNLTTKCSFQIATDVSSPLCGPDGAAYVFAPQKGATEPQVELLERSLSHFADVLEAQTEGCRRTTPGAGAAGGTAFGLGAALNASILPGFQWIAGLIGLDDKMVRADVVITGEGRVDESTLQGKTVLHLWQSCTTNRKPLLVVAGSVSSSVPSVDGVHFVAAAADNALATSGDIAAAVVRGLSAVYS